MARAIARFRQSGKKTVVFSQGFGPFGQGNREYYLASFFEKIYMQPHTTIGLTGIGIEVPFAREVLDKIGVTPEYYTRYEYKSAMMSLTDKQMSAPYRANMTGLVKSLVDELKEGISANRELTEDLDKIINRAPLSAEEGKSVNLIDDLLYLSELEKLLKDDGIKNFVGLEDYVTQFRPNEGDLPTIAVLNLSGVIDTGESSSDIDGEFVLGSQSVLA
ncbi:MAG: S49 family peptidase, partial [Alphaproteobacteria bacterium]|nr:S49 family peptidase [Alphaproteobacteria bacterium]